MKLLIVIPALNEEQSIESIIQRSLDARAHIIAGSPVTARLHSRRGARPISGSTSSSLAVITWRTKTISASSAS